MNIDTIAVPKETAITKLADLKRLKKSVRTEEDDALLSLYTSVARHGARLLSLGKAFAQTGLNERQQPLLAIAKGDWKQTVFQRNGTGGSFTAIDRWWLRENTKQIVRLHSGTFASVPTERTLSTQVPYVPANVRPRYHLRNYHILFEVEEWTPLMSKDPFLLKHLFGDLYAIVAEWDLTELEASLVGSMRRSR